MVPSPPFVFEQVGRDLVDQANGLRLAGHQWPEYEFTVSLDPLHGPQAEAWPLRERAYYEFGCDFGIAGGERTCTLTMVLACQPFERDFPGRSEELLDVIIPLVMGTSLNSFPSKEAGVLEIYPEKMREVLRSNGKYFRHKDEPGTPEYRRAHPAPRDPLGARLIRGLRDFFF